MGVGVGFDMTRSNIPFGSLDICVLIKSLTEQRQKPYVLLGLKTYYSNEGATIGRPHWNKSYFTPYTDDQWSPLQTR